MSPNIFDDSLKANLFSSTVGPMFNFRHLRDQHRQQFLPIREKKVDSKIDQMFLVCHFLAKLLGRLASPRAKISIHNRFIVATDSQHQSFSTDYRTFKACFSLFQAWASTTAF